MQKTTIEAGKYRFQIIDNTLTYDNKVLSRNFKIGGNLPDCVNVSVHYENNQPVSAYIPYILHDPECSLETPLEHGKGVVLMVKTLLRHIHKELPQITEVDFEDKSNIECATEDEINKSSRFRKKGTNVRPIPLYYFSIAFNGETWYEKYFQAQLKNPEKYNQYRTRVDYLLNSQEFKNKLSFLDFLEIAKPYTVDYLDELNEYYKSAKTFAEFFQSIPKNDRCRLLREWIGTFMSHYLRDTFSNADWIIPITEKTITGGSKRRTRKKKYYCPNKIIRHCFPFVDLGIDPYNC